MADEPRVRPWCGSWWIRLRVILFLALAILGGDAAAAAFRSVWRQYDPDDYHERVGACRREGCDLLLVGGSPMSEGVDPAVLAGVVRHGRPLEHPFNLGLPGATATDIWHAVKHGVRTPPRLLIDGVTASDFNDSRGEPHGPETLMDLDDVSDLVAARPPLSEWYVRKYAVGRLYRVWNLYHFRNGMRLWAADQVERLWPGRCPEAAAEARAGLDRSAALTRHHGYAPLPEEQTRTLSQLKAAGGLGAPFHFLDKYRLGGHLKYLHRLLDWAEANGVEVVLVDMPVSADLEERLFPKEFAAYRAALADVERSRNVGVLRPTRAELHLTDDDFADLIHLNSDGGARFSAWLRRALDDSARAGIEGARAGAVKEGP